MLHVNYAIEDVLKTSEDFYFRLDPYVDDPDMRLRQRYSRSYSRSIVFADGVSDETKKGIGYGGGCNVENIQPNGIVVSFDYYWTTDDGSGHLDYYVIFPFDRAHKIRIGRLSASSTFERVTKEAQKGAAVNP